MTSKQVVAAREMVLRFLRLMEGRNLEAAQALLSANARITFPGGKVYANQREMAAAAQGRYRWVRKTFEQVDAFQTGEAQIVYVMGALYGVNRHGLSFEGVRYVDRFVVRNGRIISQDVWNDLAESGVLELTKAS